MVVDFNLGQYLYTLLMYLLESLFDVSDLRPAQRALVSASLVSSIWRSRSSPATAGPVFFALPASLILFP